MIQKKASSWGLFKQNYQAIRGTRVAIFSTCLLAMAVIGITYYILYQIYFEPHAGVPYHHVLFDDVFSILMKSYWFIFISIAIIHFLFVPLTAGLNHYSLRSQQNREKSFGLIFSAFKHILSFIPYFVITCLFFGLVSIMHIKVYNMISIELMTMGRLGLVFYSFLCNIIFYILMLLAPSLLSLSLLLVLEKKQGGFSAIKHSFFLMTKDSLFIKYILVRLILGCLIYALFILSYLLAQHWFVIAVAYDIILFAWLFSTAIPFMFHLPATFFRLTENVVVNDNE